MARIRFKAHGKWVSFTTKRRAKPARKAAPARRRGTWPKGKVPKHLKKFLFRRRRR